MYAGAAILRLLQNGGLCWLLCETSTIRLTNPDSVRLHMSRRAEKHRMENREAASVSCRAKYGDPAKSVPLELSAYTLSLLHFVSNVQANISCFLSLFLSFFSVCHTSRPLPLSVCLYLVHRASWRMKGTTPSCQPSRSLAAGSVSA